MNTLEKVKNMYDFLKEYAKTYYEKVADGDTTETLIVYQIVSNTVEQQLVYSEYNTRFQIDVYSRDSDIAYTTADKIINAVDDKLITAVVDFINYDNDLESDNYRVTIDILM